MPADDRLRANGPAMTPDQRNEQRLDDALRDTFPASDPVAMLEPSQASPEPPVVAPVVGARQGVTGHNVRYVLAYGLIGVVLAFVVVYFLYRA